MDKLVKKIYDPHRGNLRGTHRMGGPIFRSLKLNPLSQKFTYLAKMLNLREVHIWYGYLKYWGM
jgi:hypothetical protein